jgi:hypothetical protein
MKVYPSLDVDLTYQNFGSTWLCILRGKTEDIDLVFNGLYNLGATNGDYQFFDHAKTVATFWSDRKGLLRFLFNQAFLPIRCGNKGVGKIVRRCMRQAQKRILELRTTGHEVFLDFENKFELTVHGIGKVTAERPDSDFKDAVMSNAFKDRS